MHQSMRSPRARSVSTTRLVPSTRGPFLVAGDQEGDGAPVMRVRPHELLGGGHHGGQAALHVGRAAPVEHAVADAGLEGLGAPFLQRARWAPRPCVRQSTAPGAGAAPRPEVLDRPESQLLDLKPAAAGVRPSRPGSPRQPG